MQAYNRKLALVLSAVTVAVAGVAGVATGLLTHDRTENTLVAQTVQDAQRLLQHPAYRLEGDNGTRNAQAGAQALLAAHFDAVQIYTPGGLLVTEQLSEDGRALARENELPVNRVRGYAQPWFERRMLPGQRALVRMYVPLRDENDALTGYLEAARLTPPWQSELMAQEAQSAGWLVALAVLLGGLATYPVMMRLHAASTRRQRELLESHIAMMEALGRAIARCDSDSDAHNYRVAWISATLAEAVGLHGSRMQELIVGSFLHDVGKIGIPDHILLKPGPLSEEEMRIMRTHVGLGEDIVSGAGWLGGGQAVVANHHERWDGSGYPRGQSGTDIPLVARIFAIADVFDNLCSRRPYKEPMPLEQAMQQLQQNAGKQFDPHLVQVFTDLASSVYRTVTEAGEEQLQLMLERMVRKHFSL